MSDTPLPDKCQHCGLRVKYDFESVGDSMSSDKAFVELHRLHDAGIIPVRYRRSVSISNTPDDFGSTEICAIASDSWLKRGTSCKFWVLRVNGASVADYLAIHHARVANRTAIVLGVVGALVALTIALVGGS